MPPTESTPMFVSLRPLRCSGLIRVARLNVHKIGTSQLRLVSTSSSALPEPPHLPELVTDEDHAAAATWLAKFGAGETKIGKELVELTFSRSSGPGGQNVNKVNTKATLRCPIDSKWIPRWATRALVKNPHYVASSHSLLVTSTVHRSQSQNISECLEKLHEIILQAASSGVQKAPSKEQQQKVDKLMRAEKERRKTSKMKRSAVKQDRRSSGKGWDY